MKDDDRSAETDEFGRPDADPESARILETDARDRLAAMGIEHGEALVLAKEYVAAEPGGDVEDFIEFVRSRRRAT